MPGSFDEALQRERAVRAAAGREASSASLPVMALRPDENDPELLDDVVVQQPLMFRAEAMSDTSWWLACYFAGGEEVRFQAHIADGKLRFRVLDTPENWADWDERPDLRADIR